MGGRWLLFFEMIGLLHCGLLGVRFSMAFLRRLGWRHIIDRREHF